MNDKVETGLDAILAASREQLSPKPNKSDNSPIQNEQDLVFGEAAENLDTANFDNSLVFGSGAQNLAESAVLEGTITPDQYINTADYDIDWGGDTTTPEITVEQFLNMSRTNEAESPATQIWGSEGQTIEVIKSGTIKQSQDDGPPDVPDMDLGI